MVERLFHRKDNGLVDMIARSVEMTPYEPQNEQQSRVQQYSSYNLSPQQPAFQPRRQRAQSQASIPGGYPPSTHFLRATDVPSPYNQPGRRRRATACLHAPSHDSRSRSRCSSAWPGASAVSPLRLRFFLSSSSSPLRLLLPSASARTNLFLTVQ